MTVWAISDLHLSFARPERRERYAARWRDHAARIEQNWREAVGDGDLVLLPGDISMARNHRELQPDLDWLHRLPGTKVLAPGNHDRWWNSVEAIRPILRSSLRAVEGDSLSVHEIVVCGTAGAPVPADDTSAAEQVAAATQLEALRHALDQATRLRIKPNSPVCVLWHYPPFDAHGRPGPCVQLVEQASVTACVYGHLHNQREWPAAVQGLFRGVRYHCVAADAIGFRPLRIFGKEGIASPLDSPRS
jgi:predicted phosphohydrolase